MIRSFTSSEELKIRTITVSKPLNFYPSLRWTLCSPQIPQISLEKPPPPHPLACKLYASCACCVNIKFRVHVYNVFAWISLHSLLAVAVSVCRFSFASVTEQWHDDIYNTRRNWKHLPSLILHSKLVLYEGWLGNKKICKLWIYERNEHGKNWTQFVPFGHLKFRCLLF